MSSGLTRLGVGLALARLASVAPAQSTNLASYSLIGSHALLTNAGSIKEVTRSGVVVGEITIPSGTAQIEAITMDDRGHIHLVPNNGGFGTSQIASCDA